MLRQTSSNKPRHSALCGEGLCVTFAYRKNQPIHILGKGRQKLLVSVSQMHFLYLGCKDKLCYEALGTPDEDDWPEIRELPDYPKVSFTKREPAP